MRIVLILEIRLCKFKFDQLYKHLSSFQFLLVMYRLRFSMIENDSFPPTLDENKRAFVVVIFYI